MDRLLFTPVADRTAQRRRRPSQSVGRVAAVTSRWSRRSPRASPPWRCRARWQRSRSRRALLRADPGVEHPRRMADPLAGGDRHRRHDHGGSGGAFAVVSGALEERILVGGVDVRRRIAAGEFGVLRRGPRARRRQPGRTRGDERARRTRRRCERWASTAPDDGALVLDRTDEITGDLSCRRRCRRPTSRGPGARAACSTGSARRRRPRGRSGRAGMDAVEQPPAVGLPLRPHDLDGLGHPGVRIARRRGGSSRGRAARRSASSTGTRTSRYAGSTTSPVLLRRNRLRSSRYSSPPRRASPTASEPPVARSNSSSPSSTLIVVSNEERTEPFSASQFQPPSSSRSSRIRSTIGATSTPK